MDSFGNILSLYNVERQIFHRMLFMIGMEADMASLVIGFWLCLEWLGHVNIIQKVSKYDDKTLTLAAAEAQAAIAYIESDEITNPTTTPLPFTSTISNRDFTLDHFYVNRQIFREGLERVLEDVCNLVFRDILDERGVQPLSGEQLVRPVRPFGEGTSHEGAAQEGFSMFSVGPPLGRPDGVGSTAGPDVPPTAPVVVLALPAQTTRSTLNPMARPWTPEMAIVPVQRRTLFVTFSCGLDPPTRDEITNFFTGMYGDCVESVYIHLRGNEPALFGKVVFRSATMIEIVMKGVEVMKLTLAGKPFWCRRFDPRSQGRWRRGERR